MNEGGVPAHAAATRRNRAVRASRHVASASRRYLPALVIILLVSLAAGLFAGLYSHSLARPTPGSLAAGTVVDEAVPPGFVSQLDRQIGTRLSLETYPSPYAGTAGPPRNRGPILWRRCHPRQLRRRVSRGTRI